MIAKSYEIIKNKSKFLKYNFFLLYGENYGLKKDIQKLIKTEFNNPSTNLEILTLYENDITEVLINEFGAESSKLGKIEIVKRVDTERKKNNTDQCVQLGLQEFAKVMPERGFVIQMKLENLSNLKISERIGRTLGATKEYVSQSYKKLGPFIKHCEKGSE